MTERRCQLWVILALASALFCTAPGCEQKVRRSGFTSMMEGNVGGPAKIVQPEGGHTYTARKKSGPVDKFFRDVGNFFGKDSKPTAPSTPQAQPSAMPYQSVGSGMPSSMPVPPAKSPSPLP